MSSMLPSLLALDLSFVSQCEPVPTLRMWDCCQQPQGTWAALGQASVLATKPHPPAFSLQDRALLPCLRQLLPLGDGVGHWRHCHCCYRLSVLHHGLAHPYPLP